MQLGTSTQGLHKYIHPQLHLSAVRLRLSSVLHGIFSAFEYFHRFLKLPIGLVLAKPLLSGDLFYAINLV